MGLGGCWRGNHVLVSTLLMLRYEAVRVTSTTLLMLHYEVAQVTFTTLLVLRKDIVQVFSTTLLMLPYDVIENLTEPGVESQTKCPNVCPVECQ